MVVVIAMLALTGSQARAAPVAESTLVLGVARDGIPDPYLLSGVVQQLRDRGQDVVLNPVSLPSQSCSQPRCLDEAAQRNHAHYVLSLQVGTAGGYELQGTLYDAERHAFSQQPSQARCDCSAQDLIARLTAFSVSLIADYEKHPASNEESPASANPPAHASASTGDAAATAGLAATAPHAATQPASGFYLSTSRKIAAGVVGALTLGALSASIYLTTLDGTQQANSTCTYQGGPPVSRCYWDTRTGYAIGYAATGVGLLGIGLILFVHEKKAKTTIAANP
jgi:hypothetical protein